MCRTVQQFLIATTLSLLATSATAESITMAFEQTLDLDTGTVSDMEIIPDEPTGADVVISYNADRVDHAVVFPVSGAVEMVFVADVLCTNLFPTDMTGMTFTSEPIDQALSTNNCVVVRTDQGLLYKLGGVVESDEFITFNYTQML